MTARIPRHRSTHAALLWAVTIATAATPVAARPGDGTPPPSLTAVGRSQALLLGQIADEAAARGEASKAIGYALAGLPNAAWPERAVEPELETALLRSAAGQYERGAIVAHKGDVVFLRVSPGGTRALSVGEDDAARLWNLHTGTLVAELGSGAATRAELIDCSIERDRQASALFQSGHNAGSAQARACGDALDTAEIRRPADRADLARRFAFSDDGNSVAVTFHGKLGLWDTGSGKQLIALDVASPSETAPFALGDVIVATSVSANRIDLFDRASGLAKGSIDLGGSPVTAIVLSPDGNRLAAIGSDQALRIWDVAGRKLLATKPGQSSYRSLIYTPDGAKLVSFGGFDPAGVWDAASAKPLATLACTAIAEQPDPVVSDAPSDDNIGGVEPSRGGTSALIDARSERIVLQCHDGALLLFDLENGMRLRKLADHVEGVPMLRDDSIIARVGDRVAAWSLSDGGESSQPGLDDARRLFDIGREGPGLALVDRAGVIKTRRRLDLPDLAIGRVAEVQRWRDDDAPLPAAGGRDSWVSAEPGGALRVWRTTSPFSDRMIDAHEDTVHAVTALPGGHFVTSAADKTAILWDAATLRKIATLGGHSREVYRAYANGDGSRILTDAGPGFRGMDNGDPLRLWDGRDGRFIAALDHAGREIRGVAMAAGRPLIVTVANGEIRFWNAADGSLTHQAAIDGNSYDVAINLVGDCVAVATEHGLRVWRGDFRGKPAAPGSPDDFTDQVLFSPDGTTLLSVSGRKVVAYAVPSLSPRFTIESDRAEGNVRLVRFSPRGGVLATVSTSSPGTIVGNSSRVAMWSTVDGRRLSTAEGGDWVRHIEFSADDQKLLVSASTAALFDVVSGGILSRLGAKTYIIGHSQFVSDRFALSADLVDGQVHLWSLTNGVAIWSAQTSGSQFLEDLGDHPFALIEGEPPMMIAAVGDGRALQRWRLPGSIAGSIAFARGLVRAPLTDADLARYALDSRARAEPVAGFVARDAAP